MTSKMKKEALEAARVVGHQILENQKLMIELGSYLRSLDIHNFVSIARGSSDHACQYLNFLIMNKLGILPSSLSLSIHTMYGAKLNVKNALATAISQSGQSPDVVNPLNHFSENALSSIALVNDTTSPLAQKAKWTIPLHANKEESVAATKSFIASLSASAHLGAAWAKDEKMLSALNKLPDSLLRAQSNSWSEAVDILKGSKRMMTIGRGYTFPLALESALKFKEVCTIQAEAFSGAEIKHGPQALIEEGYPLLIFATQGPTLKSMLELAKDMESRGARVILAAPESVKERMLTIESTGHEELDIICAAQSFYLMIEELSIGLGLNPDTPKHLNKVTKTH